LLKNHPGKENGFKTPVFALKIVCEKQRDLNIRKARKYYRGNPYRVKVKVEMERQTEQLNLIE